MDDHVSVSILYRIDCCPMIAISLLIVSSLAQKRHTYNQQIFDITAITYTQAEQGFSLPMHAFSPIYTHEFTMYSLLTSYFSFTKCLTKQWSMRS